MNQDEHKIVVRRMAGLIAAASVLIAVYVLRLIFLQLVNSDSFKAQATNTTDYNFTVTAARGDIVDSAGRRIAASTTSYNVVLSKLLMGDEDLDAMLQRIVELLEAHGEKWNDSLLIGEPDAAGHYSFTAQADSTSDQKALAAMKDSLGLQQYATADDVMEKLVEDYKLESYPLHWQRVLGASGVCRIDFMMDGDTGMIYVNEINTIPGSLAYYLWQPVGVSFTQLMDRLVSQAIDRQRRREKMIFSYETNLLASYSANKNNGGTKGTKGTK